MGDHEEWSQPRGGLSPNGLLPNAGPLLESLDSVRWSKAEERTAELIACIQPNQPSEERRNAVADYVQRLIMKCFPCQVFTFGSVPLKTYLPDGDIDLTAFSNSANLKDSWASEVRDMLETEEKNENAEFHVKEVQYIQAEVKIIKCLVENIVVDISFNQLGGLCTLCFLEEVDNLINHNHLFKRSIILIKAWCYYESRILGAHHGLISTYALETLVLYIFHVFNNSFAGPLEVLYRFLEFFSNFDWENFCVSLWGPVPISSLPDVTAEPPRKDSGELLLNKVFLNACSTVYAVFPRGQDNQGQTFVSKHFNVIDPLRVSNNLGRSVSKGNFFRIRSAFAFGAKRLARLLDCPQENLVAEVNQFFTNTWERHGSGVRPDAPTLTSQPLTENSKVNPNKKVKQFVNRGNNNNQLESAKPQTTPDVTAPPPRVQKGRQNNLISGQLVNDIQRSPFARTRSSPELTDIPKSGNTQTALGTDNKKMSNDPSFDSNNGSSLYQSDLMSEQMSIHQEEQDRVNMMAASGIQGYNGQIHMPMAMSQFPFPFPPSFLAGMGYAAAAQRNFTNSYPMPFPPQLTHFGIGIGITDSDSDYEPEKANSEIVPVVEDTRAGMSYVPPPRRVPGSGGALKSQHKYNKEKRGPVSHDHDTYPSHSDERITSSRFSSSAHSNNNNNNSIKSKTSSESSWDETLAGPKKEKRGKKVVISAESTSAQPSEDDDVDNESITSGMIFGHNSRRMMETSGAIPLTFYPTGPPVPFLTMLPFYNVPSQPSTSRFDDVSTDTDDIINQSDNSSNSNFGPPEGLRGAGPGEPPCDILNSDFIGHWRNLQFGRSCQGPRQHGPGPTGYPSSPVMVPPGYLQGRVPWDGPGRPLPNLTMNYGPRLVPVSPPVSRPPPNVYRSGTGTYLPNPKVAVRDRDRHGSRRGSYNHDRNENHGEGNWNGNSKPRGPNRNHNRNQMDKPRSVGSYRHEPVVHGGGPSGNGSSPYESNSAGFGSHSEQLEFGSLGQVPQQRGSPDGPSSPRHQRRV